MKSGRDDFTLNPHTSPAIYGHLLSRLCKTMELYRTENERAIGVKTKRSDFNQGKVGEEEFAMCPELTPIVSPDPKEFVTATLRRARINGVQQLHQTHTHQRTGALHPMMEYKGEYYYPVYAHTLTLGEKSYNQNAYKDLLSKKEEDVKKWKRILELKDDEEILGCEIYGENSRVCYPERIDEMAKLKFEDGKPYVLEYWHAEHVRQMDAMGSPLFTLSQEELPDGIEKYCGCDSVRKRAVEGTNDRLNFDKVRKKAEEIEGEIADMKPQLEKYTHYTRFLNSHAIEGWSLFSVVRLKTGEEGLLLTFQRPIHQGGRGDAPAPLISF
jgi:hypothetical protein